MLRKQYLMHDVMQHLQTLKYGELLVVYLVVTGMLIAYVVTPTVLPEKLLGKSPEYVAYYTSIYQKLVKNDQITHATIGCVIGTGTMVGLWIILISAADSPYGY